MRDFIVILGDKACSGHARAPEIGVAFRLSRRQGARRYFAVAAFGSQSFQANGFTAEISAANDGLMLISTRTAASDPSCPSLRPGPVAAA